MLETVIIQIASKNNRKNLIWILLEIVVNSAMQMKFETQIQLNKMMDAQSLCNWNWNEN